MATRIKKPPLTDIDGNPIPPPVKCVHCGRTKWDHKADGKNCPSGMKHRTIGWTTYAKTVFTPKEKK